MRTLFVVITLLVLTAIYAPMLLIARLFGVPHGPGSIYQWVIKHWSGAIVRAAGVKVRIHGSEVLEQLGLNDQPVRRTPTEGAKRRREELSTTHAGALFVSNHVSWFDIFALASVIPHCTFVAKSELRKIPMFGFGADAAGVIFLDRDNRKQAFQSYEGAAEQVRRGRSVVVCPEGTRGRDYHLRPFKKGPFVLAITAQSPTVPTVVHGQREIMPKGSFWIRWGTIDIHFLEPVPTTGYDYGHRAELMSVVWHRMADAMRDLYAVGTSEFPIAGEGERTDEPEN